MPESESKVVNFANYSTARIQRDSFKLVPNNLPVQLTSFIGRGNEIAEVKRLLNQTHLLTLTGAGGVGKSRLSLQVAVELMQEFEAGVRLVELTPLSDPKLVPQALATTLNLREEPNRPITATLTDYLQPKNLLLVLDNCEHLIEAVAQLSETLLKACPNLWILASSRESLGVAGEISYRVPSLTFPDQNTATISEKLNEYEAVRLFSERATASRPDFSITAQNSPALVQICTTLDGIPLAIELAAARVKTLSLEQIVTRLTDRFQLLTNGNRTALTRHQTLRALIDWSYNLLSEPEQKLWQRLTVFTGGWSLEAAEAVCSGEGIGKSEVLDLLNQLVNKSLVIVEEQVEVIRFRFLETIRQYGLEKLKDKGELAKMQLRHAEYFEELVRQLEPKLKGAEQDDAEKLIDQDISNVLAAIKWAIANHNSRISLSIESPLIFYAWKRDFYIQHMQLLTEMLTLPVPDDYEQLKNRASCLLFQGQLAMRLGDQAQAIKLHKEGLAVYKAIGDKQGVAWALSYTAIDAINQAEYHKVLEYVEEALEIYRELNDVNNVPRIMFLLNLLGMKAIQQGQYSVARQHLEEAMAFKEAVGKKHIQYYVTRANLMLATQAQGDYAVAQVYLTEDLVDAQEEGHHLANVSGSLAFSTIQTAGLAEQSNSNTIKMIYLNRAARLIGAADFMLASFGIVLDLPERDFYQRARLYTLNALGQEAFNTGSAEGQLLTRDQVVDYALQAIQVIEPTDESSKASAPNPTENPDKLTNRELEVLKLVAEGLTDPQIAEKLSLSPRTVNAHLRTIFSKLDVTTRTAATRYAIEHQLL